MDRAQEQKILAHAWQFGHFRNPDYPNTHNIEEFDLGNLTLADTVSIQAVTSVQNSDWHLEHLTSIHHGRRAILDGDAGPATLGLIEIPRCGVPDFGSEFGEAGVGGWLECDPESDAAHSVRIRFDDRRASSKWRGYIEEVKREAERISADIGLAVRHLPFDADDWESQVEFKPIPGGVIGFYWIPSRGCDSIKRQLGALDTGYNPDVHMAATLWIHEGLGHGAGFSHFRGGIMNPSILRTELSWRNDPAWNEVKRLYGGEPLDLPDPPPPGGGITCDVHQDGVTTHLVEEGGPSPPVGGNPWWP